MLLSRTNAGLNLLIGILVSSHCYVPPLFEGSAKDLRVLSELLGMLQLRGGNSRRLKKQSVLDQSDLNKKLWSLVVPGSDDWALAGVRALVENGAEVLCPSLA